MPTILLAVFPGSTFSVPVTPGTIWASALIALLLASVLIFGTRAFYMKKIALVNQKVTQLESEKKELQGRVGAAPVSPASHEAAANRGFLQQVVSIILAVASLAGSLAAANPLLVTILDFQGQKKTIVKQKLSLDFYNKLVSFDEEKWDSKSTDTPPHFKGPKKVNAFVYNGTHPEIIEAESTTIKFDLPKDGARFLLRPISR
jgi:hypothetical protein